ncbi:hypothetical protein ACHAP8_005909 [Fusarium lateritium]
MKWQSFLALRGALQSAAGLELIGESDLDDGVVCYTYLSTYLAPVNAATTGGVLPTVVLPTTRGILPPCFTNRSTYLPTFTLPSDTEYSDIIQEPTSVNLFSSSDFAIPTSESDSLLPPTAATSTESPATTSGAVSGQDVIFFVSPAINGRRRFVKRVPGRFIAGNDAVEICTDAAVFSLTDGQLLDNGDPVYYAGEPYEQLGGQGPPPYNAITREFTTVNGLLVFSSSSLPSNGADFCQDDSGQVYITFGTSPPGCDPVSIRVYPVEQCQDGRIIGLDDATTTEPNQSTTIAEPTITASSAITIPFDSSSTIPGVASAFTKVSQSSDASPETFKTTQTSESTQAPGTSTTGRVTGETSDSQPSASSSSPPTTETSLSLTISMETTTASQSFSSFLSSYTTTASSDSFSSVSTQSTDLSSSEAQSSEVSISITISTEPSSSFLLSTESSLEESTTISDILTTTTEESTTTSEEPTTTTTTLCNSVDPLTTVALANPTPVFNDNSNHGNDVGSIILPWGANGLVGTGQNQVFISTNGVIMVNRALLPYWDGLYLDQSKGHTIVYEIFEGKFGVELVIEFILGKFNSPGIYHFEANFIKDGNDGIRFQYYTTPEKGSSATVGFQNLLTGRSAQVSFNAANVIVDGTAVEIVTSQTNLFFAYTFDNTECGKGQDRLPETP